jgi:hypothetical protein
LKEDYPKRITVYLIEAQRLVIGEPLSKPVEATMRKLADQLLADLALRTPSNQLTRGVSAGEDSVYVD